MYNQNHESGIIMDKKGKNITSYKNGDRYDDRTDDIVAGRNPVIELLKSGREIDKLYVQRGSREGSINLIIAEAKKNGVPIIDTDKSKLDMMCRGLSHQGVAAIAAQIEYADVEDLLEIARERGESPFIIIADCVEDPHNLGAIIRTAECAGVHGVIIPKRRAATVNASVAKSAAGALEYVKVARVSNLAQAVKTLKENGVWIYSADMDGQEYTGVDYTGACALILGGENGGVSHLMREESDFIVSMPLCGKVSSLNVSNAGAVLMYEVVRQRRLKK